MYEIIIYIGSNRYVKKIINKIKGFTVIELLVVVAIIGLLVAIILVLILSAKAKAKDSRVKGSIQQMRTLAESAATGSNSYILVDLATGAGLTLKNEIEKQAGIGALRQSKAADGSSFCASSVLPSKLSTSFCLDTTGNVTAGACVAGLCGTSSPPSSSCPSGMPSCPPSYPPTSPPPTPPTPTPYPPTPTPSPSPTSSPTSSPSPSPSPSSSPS